MRQQPAIAAKAHDLSWLWWNSPSGSSHTDHTTAFILTVASCCATWLHLHHTTEDWYTRAAGATTGTVFGSLEEFHNLWRRIVKILYRGFMVEFTLLILAHRPNAKLHLHCRFLTLQLICVLPLCPAQVLPSCLSSPLSFPNPATDMRSATVSCTSPPILFVSRGSPHDMDIRRQWWPKTDLQSSAQHRCQCCCQSSGQFAWQMPEAPFDVDSLLALTR